MTGPGAASPLPLGAGPGLTEQTLGAQTVPEEAKARVPEVDWRGAARFRDIIAHRYFSKGFTELKPSAYTYAVQDSPADYRVAPPDKSNMGRYLFGGFQRCLYAVQKFESDAERKLAVILEREAQKWFRPAKGQFQIAENMTLSGLATQFER